MEIRIVIGDRTLELVHLAKQVMSRRRAAIVAGTLALVGGVVTAAAQIERPAPLQAGTVARAQDINERFDALFRALEQVEERLVGMEPSAVRIESENCQWLGDSTDCTCEPNEVAIGGGAVATGGAVALVESRIGPSARAWTLGCETTADIRVACSSPQAVCLRTGH
jgi:hypothetical protein